MLLRRPVIALGLQVFQRLGQMPPRIGRLVDDIIEPADTRRHLAQALEYLQTKRDHRPPKKHGLIPL